MPRRYADYLPSDGFTTLNTVSSISAFVHCYPPLGQSPQHASPLGGALCGDGRASESAARQHPARWSIPTIQLMLCGDHRRGRAL